MTRPMIIIATFVFVLLLIRESNAFSGLFGKSPATKYVPFKVSKSSTRGASTDEYSQRHALDGLSKLQWDRTRERTTQLGSKRNDEETVVKSENLRIGVRTRLRRWSKQARKAAGSFLAASLLAVSLRNPAFAAVTGGRMGGSFSPSSRSSGGSSMRSSPSRNYYGSQPRGYGNYRPRLYTRGYSSSRLYSTGAATKMSPADMVVMTGAGALVVYGLVNNRRDPDSTESSALGRGVSVASVTVALDVPNRDDNENILRRLQKVSETADTSKRSGVQDLVSGVALELLRQERSIVGAVASYRHFGTINEAQREFNRLSVTARSKFDKETVNRFGGADLGETTGANEDDESSRATAAVVTLTISIEGDKTVLPGITARDDLLTSLSRIAADAQVDECLLAGEVLWAPESRGDKLEKEDVVADYPNLFPL